MVILPLRRSANLACRNQHAEIEPEPVGQGGRPRLVGLPQTADIVRLAGMSQPGRKILGDRAPPVCNSGRMECTSCGIVGADVRRIGRTIGAESLTVVRGAEYARTSATHQRARLSHKVAEHKPAPVVSRRKACPLPSASSCGRKARGISFLLGVLAWPFAAVSAAVMTTQRFATTGPPGCAISCPLFGL
jgi:hypothetical protein